MSGSNPYVNPAVLQPANPLQTASSIMGIQNQQNQLQLFPLQQQEAELRNQGIGIQNDTGKFNLGQGQDQAVWQALQGQDGPTALKTLGQMLTNPNTAPGAARVTSELSNNPGDISSYVNSRIKSTEPAAAFVPSMTNIGGKMVPVEQGQQVGNGITNTPSPQMTDIGGNIIPTSGGVAIAPSIGKTNSPGNQSDLVDGPLGPNGEKTQITRAQALGALGANPQTGQSNNVPSNPALVGPNGVPAPKPMVISQGPGAVASQTQTAADSAKGFTDISDQGVAAKNRSALLTDLRANLSNFTSGNQGLQDFKAWLQNKGGIVGASFGLSPENIASAGSADKLVAMLQDAPGSRSDAALAITGHATPNTGMTPQTLDEVTGQMLGQSDYAQARAKAAQDWQTKNGTANKAAFEQGPASKIDPTVFYYDRASPAQKGRILSQLHGPALQNFMTNHAAQFGQ